MKFPTDVADRARTFYTRNHKSWLGGEFSSLRISLQPPTAAEVNRDDGATVRTWLEAWQGHWLEPEYTRKRLGIFGEHGVPTAVVLDSPEKAARAAGMLAQWQRLTSTLEQLVDDLGSREVLVAKLALWRDLDAITLTQLTSAVAWIRQHRTEDYFIRELPIPGIDSKWVESHRGLIEALTGPLEFRSKPLMVDLRSLDPALSIFGLRRVVCSLADASGALSGSLAPGGDVPAGTPLCVIMVENHQTFLALPDMPATIAIHGQGGFAMTIAQEIAVSARAASGTPLRVLYWGDLDSHGFHILDQVRGLLPQTQSVLMDLTTARLHRDFAVAEPSPKRFHPQHLNSDELATLDYLHREAGDSSISGCLRIEQERIGFGWVREKLAEVVVF